MLLADKVWWVNALIFWKLMCSPEKLSSEGEKSLSVSKSVGPQICGNSLKIDEDIKQGDPKKKCST